jgi:predicted nucleic acid-binding protein
MRVFLDTSVLSHKSLNDLAVKVAERVSEGDEFLVSVLTHFELLWGYRIANLSSQRYEELIKTLGIEIVPLLEEDAMFAAEKKPGKTKLLDALVASTVARYEAVLWTRDQDFDQFLPEEKIMIV